MSEKKKLRICLRLNNELLFSLPGLTNHYIWLRAMGKEFHQFIYCRFILFYCCCCCCYFLSWQRLVFQIIFSSIAIVVVFFFVSMLRQIMKSSEKYKGKERDFCYEFELKFKFVVLALLLILNWENCDQNEHRWKYFDNPRFNLLASIHLDSHSNLPALILAHFKI